MYGICPQCDCVTVRQKTSRKEQRRAENNLFLKTFSFKVIKIISYEFMSLKCSFIQS